MRCAKGCSRKLFPAPLGGAEYDVPQCPLCQGPARPHSKFEDEDYDPFFHQTQIAQGKLAACDCLILIGMKSQGSFCSTVISQAMASGALIVEVGNSPVIEFGKVKQLSGLTEEIVPLLCRTIQDKLSK